MSSHQRLTSVQVPLPIPARRGAPPEELPEKEQAAYDQVLACFANPDYVLPTKKAALIEEERMWLSYECILRFLRTTKYEPLKCIQRLEATLEWRRDFGHYTHLTPEQVESEAMTSHMFLFGYDTQDRPIIYYYPGNQTTEDGERQVQFLFWILERATEFMGPGVETITYMADFAKAPPLDYTRQFFSILQTHYPERLGVTAVTHSPILFSKFWEFAMPLMNPHTNARFIFDPVPDERGLWRTAKARDLGDPEGLLVSSDQLISSERFGGSVQFEYNHEVYWPALLAMCDKWRQELTRVWRQLGGLVGIKEWDVKIGVLDGLTVPAAVAM